MSEKFFQKLFEARGKSVFIFKMTDSGEATGMNRRRGRTDAVRIKPQPADFIVVDNGQTYFAEVKECGNKTSFPFSYIRATQIGFAKMITNAGGSYFFFVLNTNTGIWYRIPARQVLNHDKQSLKWDELEPYK